MNKKKIIGFSIAAVIALTGVIVGAKTWGDKNEDSKNKETQQVIVPPDNRSIPLKTETQNSSAYEHLLGLQYTILRNDKFEEESKVASRILDIQVNKPFSDEQLASLGKEVYRVFQKELKNKYTVDSIYLNVFTNKKAFERTIQPDYKGEYVPGFIQSYSSSHYKGNKATITNYYEFTLDTNIEKMKTDADFEVVNADNMENGKKITADVIIKTKEQPTIEDMVQFLSSMIKEVNENAEQVSLNIYSSKNDYKQEKVSFEYSTQNPRLLIKHTSLFKLIKLSKKEEK
jgi:hypothetical protein